MSQSTEMTEDTADRQRPWLREYPAGVPHRIDAPQHPTLKSLIEASCTAWGQLPAFLNMGKVLSYSDLDRRSAAFGAWLQQQGLAPGDRVAIMMPNLLQYPIAVFGALRAGLTVVNVNPLYTPRELRHQLRDSGARVIVILENFGPTLAEVRDEVPVERVVTTEVGDMLGWPRSALINAVVKHVKKLVPKADLGGGVVRFPEVLAEGARNTLRKVDVSPADIAFLQYTGGTTGVAKGAMLSHANMVANVEQSAAWLSPLTDPGREVVITALPLYHIFSLTANCLLFTKIGGCNVLITNPRDMKAFVGELRKHPFSTITGVNTLYNALLNTEGFADLDFSHLKVALGGGMAVQRAVAEHWAEVTGKPIVEAYGLTETSPAACINPLDIEAYTGAIGLPISSTNVVIRDDDGAAVPSGEVGEICIGGPQVMVGYWNRPQDTAAVTTAEGELRTGDMGYVDERGFVFVTDRKKDMIVVSGFNVYPNEVEDVMVSHPAVSEAAAVGVPNARSGEAVVAFVVLHEGAELDEAGLIAHCRTQLTNYKIPRKVCFRTELPKTNVGKILRRELRDEALAAVKAAAPAPAPLPVSGEVSS